MQLKGVWIPLEKARELAATFHIDKLLTKLLSDDPSQFPADASFVRDNSDMVMLKPLTVKNYASPCASPGDHASNVFVSNFKQQHSPMSFQMILIDGIQGPLDY